MLAKLEIRMGSRPIETFSIQSQSTTIGSAPDNVLVLQQAGIAPYQAQIVRMPQGYHLIDRGAAYPTYLNRRTLSPNQPCLLQNGDLIHLSNIELKVTLEGAPVDQLPSTRPSIPSEVSRSHLPSRSSRSDATTASLPTPDPFQIPTSTETEPEEKAPTVQPAPAASLPYSPESNPVPYEETIQFKRHRALLRIVIDNTPPQDVPLIGDRLLLGRLATNDIQIDSPFVSSVHAEIRQTEAGYEIFDRGGRNPIRFRGQPIQQKQLKDGDSLFIGPVRLTYIASPLASEPAVMQVLTFGDRNHLNMGRDSNNDVVIEHPTVSLQHACIIRHHRDYFITDLNSTNGTFVAGRQVNGRRALIPGDTIRIGPCRILFTVNGDLIPQNEAGNLRLDAQHISKTIGSNITLLDHISISIEPREFVAIVGASGTGKSTLLNALSGFRSATQGRVWVNGLDLYENFNAYRAELGYVPQADTIHLDLTVAQALEFAARLRMPTDTLPEQRQQRIQDILEELDLSTQIQSPVRDLSGGQRKRVSMGVELITQPGLLFLDEATSGLDPGTETQMMRLLRKLADQGRTVVLVTHATKNVMMCDQVAFLARGGRLAYYGPPEHALTYFDVETFDEIYTKLDQEDSPETWQKRYRQSPEFQQYVLDRQQEITASPEAERAAATHRPIKPKLRQISNWQAFITLSLRNLELLIQDRASLILTVGLAPILGFLDLFTWRQNLFDLAEGDAARAITMLFVTALVGVMLGSFATMREIVKETDIYRRERMTGLPILPYLLSKLWIGVLLAFYQAAVFLVFKILSTDLPGDPFVIGSFYFTLVLTILAGMIMGLLVSALSPNPNVAPLLTMIFLVPQITFGGGMLPQPSLGFIGQAINQVTITKWSFEALVTITDIGQDVAMDPCWQLDPNERRQLTPEEEEAQGCPCVGGQVFRSCEFPGIQASYDVTVDQPSPQRPPDPGAPPTDLEELQRYQQQMQEYVEGIEQWQADYDRWRAKYEGAVGEAEALIDRLNQNYGHAFDVNVVWHWIMLSVIMTGMFGGLVLIQKYKDLS